MQSLLAVPLAILTAAICWGVYGVVLLKGTKAMGDSRLLPFICVGLAYFIIGVLVPGIWLKLRGEKGTWTATGTIWSLAAGAAGALGALGIIMALSFGGSPIYVMPLVFGGAPVVNTFTTMYLGRSFKQVSPMFLAGLILVVAGAAIVLIFRPGHAPAPGRETLTLEVVDFVKIAGSIALTVLSWGVYGPVLHKGQMAMQGSRLRPLICVGLSYFVIAVILPFIIKPLVNDPGDWTTVGTMWSLAGGAAGAIGAIGIILAFNFGGKPIYVMPLVFGGAPIINTFTTLMISDNLHDIHPVFIAGLIMSIIGAVTVLVFAPKSHGPALGQMAAEKSKPAIEREREDAKRG